MGAVLLRWFYRKVGPGKARGRRVAEVDQDHGVKVMAHHRRCVATTQVDRGNVEYVFYMFRCTTSLAKKFENIFSRVASLRTMPKARSEGKKKFDEGYILIVGKRKGSPRRRSDKLK
ncbi:OLC1v1031579C1 [Oldenlandia corymbosa var. corymbosa]|uniref:OLC1v1031579C1 n=1 Tax=Oldenlandia corymbosa var. corymbosa TaxID=529605 RepID=A0AAV1CIW0_OLDCO|nr:OLC1v1031579C1 [Oldenlandia corymbosa var. corymbosa]